MFLLLIMLLAHHSIDCLFDLPDCWPRKSNPATGTHHDRRNLWCPSIGVHFETQMGHDRMDDFLYYRHSCFLVPPSLVLVLEDG